MEYINVTSDVTRSSKLNLEQGDQSLFLERPVKLTNKTPINQKRGVVTMRLPLRNFFYSLLPIINNPSTLKWFFVSMIY